MRRFLAAALALSFSLTAHAAFACGARLPDSDGYPGTAFAEGPDQVSVFTGNAQGYSWDRIQGPSWTRTHVLDVAGRLQGNIETDARVDTAIANQNGFVVELASGGDTSIGDKADAATTIYGAALDSKLRWQVVTYLAEVKRMALFSEGSPGQFNEVSTLDADCGTPGMLDVVIEPGDSLVSRCADQAVIVGARGQLEPARSPQAPWAWARARRARRSSTAATPAATMRFAWTAAPTAGRWAPPFPPRASPRSG